jgi:hypothetical protein
MSAVTDAMQSLPDDIEGLRALVMTLKTGTAPSRRRRCSASRAL